MGLEDASSKAALIEFPDTPVGERARWYARVRRGDNLTRADVGEQFAPSFTSGWGSPHDEGVLEDWLERWRQFPAMAVEVKEITPFRLEILWRFRGGGSSRNVFEVEEDPPYRILRFDNANGKDLAPPPGDFSVLTEVSRSGDLYHAEVHPHLVTPMGPFGGYIAAIALRAAGAHSNMPRPLSFSCHFLNPGSVGRLEAKVQTLRASSRLESLRVELVQDEKVLVEAMVWGTTDMPKGTEHVLGDITEVPRPEKVLSFQQLFPGQSSGPFQQIVEGKPLLDGWQPPGDPPWYPEPNESRPPAPARLSAWVRMLPPLAAQDPWVDAARTLVPFDWISVNASVMPHRGSWVQSPSLDTTIAFYNLEEATEWMFVRSESPIAHSGFATATASIWSENGSLIAVAMQQVMHRMMSQGNAKG